MYNYKIKFSLDIDVRELKVKNISIADTIVKSNSDYILEKCGNADNTLDGIKNQIVLILNDYVLPEFIEKINNITYGDDVIEVMEEQFKNNIGAKVAIRRCNDIIYEITSYKNISDKLDFVTLESTLAYETTNSIINKLCHENKELELDIDLYNIKINEDYDLRIVEQYKDSIYGIIELIED